ncbi:MAG: LiaF domain-containing protein [Bacteroidota bacterium]
MRDDFENRFKERWEERKRRWEERRERHGGKGHIWTGIFILIIGIAALIKASATDLPDWVFSWQTFLIVLGFFIGIKHGFRGGAWFILMLVGGAFLIPEFYPDISIRRYIWPGALILLGAMLILRPRRYRSRCREDQKKNPGPGIAKDSVTEDTYDVKEDYVDSTSVFGGAKKNIISKNFKGGDLVSIFGGTELDLTRADFTGTAKLDLTTIFGGTKLIIPANWTIQSEVVTIFGGMEDKRNMQAVTGNPEKILILDGTVIFGGIEIKSF